MYGGLSLPAPVAWKTRLGRQHCDVEGGRSPVVLSDVIGQGVSLVHKWTLALAVILKVELVEEDVVAACIRRGKAETLLTVEPLDSARVHGGGWRRNRSDKLANTARWVQWQVIKIDI